jgi:hypothetical protein
MLDNVRNSLKELLEFLKRDRTTQILIAIVLFGSCLRYWGISHAENTDEYNEVFEALRIASGHVNIHRWIKKGYQTLIALEYGIYFCAGWVAGAFKSPMDFAVKIVANMDPLFMIGRFTTATLGVLSIILTYILGKKTFDKRVGLVAALFVSVVPVHVWVSHLVNTDVPMSFFSLLALLFIWKMATTGGKWVYGLAGFLMAIAMNVKMLALPLFVPFLVAHYMNWKRVKADYLAFLWCKEIGYAAMGYLIGFILSNPAILIGLPQFVKSVFYLKDLYGNYETFDAIPYSQNGYLTYLRILLGTEYGIPLFILVITGLVYSIVKRENGDLILFPLCILHFLMIGGTDFLVQDRYLMLLIPPSLILGSRFLVNTLDRISSPKAFSNRLLVGLCLIFIIIPLYHSGKYVLSVTGPNTSELSKEWIEKNIPPGSKILMDAGRTLITSGPRLNQSREKIEEMVRKVKQLKPGETYDSLHVRIVDSYSAIYFELVLKNMPEITYDLTSTELGRKVEMPDYYKKNGYDYFIHNKGLSFRIEDPLWRQKYPKSAEFYDSFDREFKLLKTFSPSATRSGSTIKVYQVK